MNMLNCLDGNDWDTSSEGRKWLYGERLVERCRVEELPELIYVR